jgi:hypothetical protein
VLEVRARRLPRGKQLGSTSTRAPDVLDDREEEIARSPICVYVCVCVCQRARVSVQVSERVCLCMYACGCGCGFGSEGVGAREGGSTGAEKAAVSVPRARAAARARRGPAGHRPHDW